MNSRERVRRAVTFKDPDRTPVDLWYLPGVILRHGNAFWDLLEKYPVDFVKPTGKNFTLSPRYEVGYWRDEWGALWHNEIRGIIGQVVERPLADYAALSSYEPPYKILEEIDHKEIDRYIQENRDRFLLGPGGNVFERMQWLRGTTALMIDLMDDRSEVYELRDMVADLFTQQVQVHLRHDYDGVVFADDWGAQQQLLINPELWRHFFKPCYRRLFAKVKESGKLVFFHSDGYILEIIDDLIEIGVDALNSQVWCMGVPELGERFAGRICFWGELDRQWALPNGKPQDIYRAAKVMKAYLETDHGGLIGEGEAGPDVPLENIEAMLTCW